MPATFRGTRDLRVVPDRKIGYRHPNAESPGVIGEWVRRPTVPLRLDDRMGFCVHFSLGASKPVDPIMTCCSKFGTPGDLDSVRSVLGNSRRVQRPTELNRISHPILAQRSILY